MMRPGRLTTQSAVGGVANPGVMKFWARTQSLRGLTQSKVCAMGTLQAMRGLSPPKDSDLDHASLAENGNSTATGPRE